MYYLKTLFVTLMLAKQSDADADTPLHRVTMKSNSILRFPMPSTKYFGKINDTRNILLDSNNSKVIVASRGYIFQLSMKKMELEKDTDITNIKPEARAMALCKMVKDWTPCSNYLLTLVVDPQNRIVTCGTNAKKPKCWTFERKSLKLLPQLTRDARGCPKSPNISVINFYQDDYFFTATLRSKRNYEISKTKAGESKVITTHYVDERKQDSPFNSPIFVSSYSLGDGFVYFFFREIANENQNTDRTVVYSRIARVCQYDIGEPFIYQETFITYLKSQLVCLQKEKGRLSVYFDELQSIAVLHVHGKNSTSETFIYGVFATSTYLTGSSAICRYRFKDVKRVFQNSPYAEKQKDGMWIKKTHPKGPDTGRPKCDKTMENTPYNYNDAKFTVEHPLLHDHIFPYDGTAVLAMGGVRFTSLAVDDIHFDQNKLDTGIHIIFTGTADGAIYKIMMTSTNEGEPVILEKIQAFEQTEPITTMKLNRNAVFAASQFSGLVRVELQRCQRYYLCSDCVKSRDPYCAWSRTEKKCVRFDTISASDRVQNITTGNDSICPPVDVNLSCSLNIVESFPTKKTALQCLAFGKIPAKVLAWTKDDAHLVLDKKYYKVVNNSNSEQQLIIRNYTIREIGKYGCVVGVGNNKTSCSVEILASTATSPSPTTFPTASERTTQAKVTPGQRQGTIHCQTLVGPLIIVSILLGIMVLVLLILISIIWFNRYRWSADRDDEMDDFDDLDGSKTSKTSKTSRGSRQIYKIKQNGACNPEKKEKKRSRVRKRESSKSLLRDSNDKNSVYQPTVEDDETLKSSKALLRDSNDKNSGYRDSCDDAENLKTAREMDDLSGLDAKPLSL